MNPKEKTPALPTAPDEPADSAAPAPPPKPPRLSGTYKLSGFYNSGRFSDSGGGSRHHGDFSIYFIADQELWHPDGNGDRAPSFFTRIGAAPNDRNTVVFYADTGLNYKGAFASRDKDTLGLGFSYVQLSRALVDDSGASLRSHHEAVLEISYQAAFGDHVSLQPDLQFIFNPGAVRPAPTAIAAGIRLNIRY